ncbi:MAG: DUF1851 domain-containing protein [Nitrospira sp.]
MHHTRQDVMTTVLHLFPSRSAKTVLELVDLYGVEAHEPERERVQMAILALSQGNEDKLLRFVEAAKQDYRDVLYWAEYPQPSVQDNAVLEILRRKWAWALEDPTQVLMVNPFGNVLVTCHDGTLWRVIPEELAARKVRDDMNYLAAFGDEQFREDWFFEGVAEAAKIALGPLQEGQCYAFKIWPVLGRPFTPDNMYVATTAEWLGASGDVGGQIKAMPSGTTITLDVLDDGSIRIVPAEEMSSGEWTYDSVEVAVREVIALLVAQRYKDLARFTQGTPITDQDIARVIQEYGQTVVPCPEPLEDLIDIAEVTDTARPTWSVVVPLYTREEGRSDLSVELTVVEVAQNDFQVRLENVHVR